METGQELIKDFGADHKWQEAADRIEKLKRKADKTFYLTIAGLALFAGVSVYVRYEREVEATRCECLKLMGALKEANVHGVQKQELCTNDLTRACFSDTDFCKK